MRLNGFKYVLFAFLAAGFVYSVNARQLDYGLPVPDSETTACIGAGCWTTASLKSDVCSETCGTTSINAPTSGVSAGVDDATACDDVDTCTARQTVSGTCTTGL